ncbi:metal cation transporter, ZIP subfamily protein [Pelomyxa schiedti]|nr:metal cation transporter, ZIP subfamily protein [Pelomyxa schiedti]
MADDSGSTLVEAKALCGIVLTAETVCGSFVPVLLRKIASRAPNKAAVERRVHRAMSVCAAAAAGVFLGVGLCHMQPDAVSTLEGCLGELHGFPLPYFLVLLGFCLLAFLDKVFTPPHEHRLSSNEPSSASFTNDEDPSDATQPSKGQIAWKQRYAKAIVLTLGMAIHAFVTGLALGMSESMDDLMGIALACFCHEWVHAPALVVLYDSSSISKKSQIIFLCFYFTITPSSIITGTVLYTELEGSRAGYITTGVLSAIAAGTFLYIGACELMHEAFELDQKAHSEQPKLDSVENHQVHHNAIDNDGEHEDEDEKHEETDSPIITGKEKNEPHGKRQPLLGHHHDGEVVIDIHSHQQDEHDWLHGIWSRAINYGIMLFFAVGIASVAAIEGELPAVVC